MVVVPARAVHARIMEPMTEDATEKDQQAAIEAKLGVRVVEVSLDRQDP
jgi:hypothetical protein